jgi:glycosyltransferase involved in cell wall biosynthesis
LFGDYHVLGANEVPLHAVRRGDEAASDAQRIMHMCERLEAEASEASWARGGSSSLGRLRGRASRARSGAQGARGRIGAVRGVSRMPVLHVAAMPFPSVQGTQAAVRSMVDAEHAAGRAPALLTYAHGAFELRVPWAHHRIADLTRDRSLRSGPSWRKLVEDAQLTLAARKLHAELAPRYVVAHHVEATAAVLAARLKPTVFFAHTALGPELPTYLPPAAGRVAARAGDTLDVALARGADAVVAVSPLLAELLSERADRAVSYVPVPWPIPTRTEPRERLEARARFGFDPLEPVFLYAGNLDAYQGAETLARAFAAVREKRADARFLVATASDPAPLEKALWSSGCVDRARFASLADEPDRRIAHAAADAVWVPRGTPGGLPMKLLDALARGVPTVVTRRATAGLDLVGAAMVVPDEDPEALAAAALLAVEGRESAAELGRRGVAYIERAHSAERYLEALDRALGQ